VGTQIESLVASRGTDLAPTFKTTFKPESGVMH